VEYDRSPRGREDGSLLVDAGATYLGYASDITRTWTKGESAAARAFGELVRRLDELQRRLIAEIAPGVSFESLHDRAHELLAEVLCELEIVRAEPGALLESGATRAFFPHGLGHSLGVQVHDVGLRTRPPRPDNRFLRNTSAVAPGHVFTIEPGCYFIPSLMDELRGRSIAADVNWTTIDALRPFGGVRIEDNVAVTEAGTDNLTRPALDEALASVS
jgi:Xaa-Pro dipeptidase